MEEGQPPPDRFGGLIALGGDGRHDFLDRFFLLVHHPCRIAAQGAAEALQRDSDLVAGGIEPVEKGHAVVGNTFKQCARGRTGDHLRAVERHGTVRDIALAQPQMHKMPRERLMGRQMLEGIDRIREIEVEQNLTPWVVAIGGKGLLGDAHRLDPLVGKIIHRRGALARLPEKILKHDDDRVARHYGVSLPAGDVGRQIAVAIAQLVEPVADRCAVGIEDIVTNQRGVDPDLSPEPLGKTDRLALERVHEDVKGIDHLGEIVTAQLGVDGAIERFRELCQSVARLGVVAKTARLNGGNGDRDQALGVEKAFPLLLVPIEPVDPGGDFSQVLSRFHLQLLIPCLALSNRKTGSDFC